MVICVVMHQQAKSYNAYQTCGGLVCLRLGFTPLWLDERLWLSSLGWKAIKATRRNNYSWNLPAIHLPELAGLEDRPEADRWPSASLTYQWGESPRINKPWRFERIQNYQFLYKKIIMLSYLEFMVHIPRRWWFVRFFRFSHISVRCLPGVTSAGIHLKRMESQK